MQYNSILYGRFDPRPCIAGAFANTHQKGNRPMLPLIEADFPDNLEEHSLLEKMYIDYGSLMLQIAYSVLHNRADAEDAVQQAFVQIIAGLRAGASMENIKDRRSYMIVCARFAALNIARRKYKLHEIAAEPERIHLMLSDEISENYFDQYSIDTVTACLELLKPTDREILYLKFSCDLKDREIAAMTGQDRSTVSKHVKRALARLRRQIECSMGVTDNE